MRSVVSRVPDDWQECFGGYVNTWYKICIMSSYDLTLLNVVSRAQRFYAITPCCDACSEQGKITKKNKLHSNCPLAMNHLVRCEWFTWSWTAIWCPPCSFHRVPRDCERSFDIPRVPSTEYHVIVNGDLMLTLFFPEYHVIVNGDLISLCSFHRVPRDCGRRSDVPLVPSTEHHVIVKDDLISPIVPSTEYHVILNGDLMVPLFLPHSTTWLWTAIRCSPCSFHRVPRDCERWSDVFLVPSIEYHVILNGDLMFPLFLPQSTTWLWVVIWCSSCSFYRVPGDRARRSDAPLVPSTEYHVIVNGDLMHRTPCSFHRVLRDLKRRSDVHLVPSTEHHVIVDGDLMFPLFLPQSTTSSWAVI